MAIVYKREKSYECHAFSSEDPSRLSDFCHQLNEFLATAKLSKASSLTSLIDDKHDDEHFATECEYCGSSPIGSQLRTDIREVHRIIYAHQQQGNDLVSRPFVRIELIV